MKGQEKQMNKTVYIYTLSDPRDGRVRYVGATSQRLKKRLSNHKADAKSRNSAPVHKWINSLLDEGLEPIMDIVDSGDTDIWEAKEKYWIQRCKDTGCDLLNQTDGGVHCVYDEEYRRKISGKNHPMYGLRGEKHPMYRRGDERRGQKNPMYGRRLFSERNGKSRRIAQYTRDGLFIRYWNAMMDVSRELQIDHSHITKCCKGKQKSAGGYIWRYADDPIPQTEQPRLFQDEDK